MPFPAIPAILGVSTLVGGQITRATILSGARSGFSQFGKALPFGAGYSFGTYLGFPKNFVDKSGYRPQVLNADMPFNYGYRRNNRKIRVWSRKYRRYIWVYPRRY